jgi:hypothetical protein
VNLATDGSYVYYALKKIKIKTEKRRDGQDFPLLKISKSIYAFREGANLQIHFNRQRFRGSFRQPGKPGCPTSESLPDKRLCFAE